MPTTLRYGALTSESAATRYDAPQARGLLRDDRARTTTTRPSRPAPAWRAPSERLHPTRYVAPAARHGMEPRA